MLYRTQKLEYRMHGSEKCSSSRQCQSSLSACPSTSREKMSDSQVSDSQFSKFPTE
uniref:Uncharacterized protein n=1 Tax=Romanomermis culicivorax TaxID=13658 RepID=A0A915HGX5_ROMCU